MNCPQCKTPNEDDYVFCVNCGIPIPSDEYKTARMASPVPTQTEPLPPTVFVKEARYQHPTPPSIEPNFGVYDGPRRSKAPWIAGLAVIFLAAAGGLAFLILRQTTVEPEPPEVLPEYLGLFVRQPNGTAPVEVKRLEYASVLEARDAMRADIQPQKLDKRPEFLLYADAAEMPLSDLKLIRLDSITDDGRFRYADFQAAIIDEKPAIKRLMLRDALSNGRYAFAQLSGFFNEGRHRFWPFEVTGNSGSGIAFDLEASVALKPADVPVAPAPQEPTPVTLPAGATIAYCRNKDVWLRKTPEQDQKGKILLLKQGQKVYVIKYSENYSVWNGISSNWAFVQTEAGKQGWVFNVFLDHGEKN